MRCVLYLLTSFLFYQQAHLMRVHTIVNIYNHHHHSQTTPKPPHHHAYPGAALNSFCSFCVSVKYCLMLYTPHRYVTVTQLNRFNNSDWSLLSYVFIEWQTQKNPDISNFFQSIVVTQIQPKKKSDMCMYCSIFYTQKHYYHRYNSSSSIFLWTKEKITKWCTESKKNTHITESSMIESGSSNGELIWYYVTLEKNHSI